VFEVEHDGELIYSKKKTGQFPLSGEVEKILAERLEGCA
jgi:predicted Rdx family selenoprotein